MRVHYDQTNHWLAVYADEANEIQCVMPVVGWELGDHKPVVPSPSGTLIEAEKLEGFVTVIPLGATAAGPQGVCQFIKKWSGVNVSITEGPDIMTVQPSFVN